MADRARETLRLFIAARCPASPELCRVLERLEACGPDVKPVAAGDLHLTLRFLGDTPAQRVTPLAEAIDRAAAAAATGPIAVRWVRLGRFPLDRHKPPRVIHASPADPEPFERLAHQLDAALSALDPPVPPPSRPFHAHLTLARVKAGRTRRRPGSTAGTTERLETLLREHETAELGDCRIEALQLIASDLTPKGPVHRIMHETPL